MNWLVGEAHEKSWFVGEVRELHCRAEECARTDRDVVPPGSVSPQREHFAPDSLSVPL